MDPIDHCMVCASACQRIGDDEATGIDYDYVGIMVCHQQWTLGIGIDRLSYVVDQCNNNSRMSYSSPTMNIKENTGRKISVFWSSIRGVVWQL